MKTKIFAIIVIIAAIVIGGNFAMAQYTPVEPIPGSGGTGNISTFPDYVQAIYKFAVWSVGIAALLMISIGGFMYFTAAGNTSKTESAKRVIADALFGLLAVMVASMILYKINPDLININLSGPNNSGQNNQQAAPDNGLTGGGGGGGWTGGTQPQNNNSVGNGGQIRDANGNILEPQPLQ